MARKPKRPEEHTNHESWAIPYGDLVTLLLAFFVVMYALSTVNQGKYRLLSDSLYAAFRGEPRTLDPVQLGQHQAGAGADSHTGVLQQLRADPQHALAAGQLVKLAPQAPQVAPTRAAELAAQAAQREAALARVADQVQSALGDLVQRNLMTVRRKEMWVEIELRTDILFTSGSAQPAPAAVPVLDRLGHALAPLPNAVRVEGYTDNVPIRTSVFYSNWELSAARAGSVVRVLSSQGIDPTRLAVVGYGEQRPLAGNDTAEGRNANRRVVVVILSVESSPAEAAPAVAPPAAAPAPADAPTVSPPADAATATTAQSAAPAPSAAPPVVAPPPTTSTPPAPGAAAAAGGER
jgi:chemotaxis protein MotB